MIRRYGVPYKGSKNQVAEWVCSHFPKATNFYDIFAGGCAITHCAMEKNIFQNYSANDIADAHFLFMEAVYGKFQNETRWISREDFFALKDKEPYVKYCWSFGNRGLQYLYSKELEPYKRACHYAIVFDDWKELERLCPEIINEAKESLISGLKEEINKKEYTKNLPFNQTKFNEFVEKVLFVVNDKTEKEYIKGIIKTEKINIVLDENKLIAIFNEIRDRQASKKNTSNIEGITIQIPSDALNYGRHLTADEIRLLIVNRLLLGNPFDSRIPTTFLSEVLINMPPERMQDETDNCRASIAKVLFNKNLSDNFWKLFENIYITIKQLPKSSSLNDIYKKLDKDLIQNCSFLDILSIKYLISAIKDGIYDN